MFGRTLGRRNREAPGAAESAITSPSTDLMTQGARHGVPEALPRIEEALVALVVNARRIDERLGALEKRLDEHALDLSTVADLATRADLDQLNAAHRSIDTQLATLTSTLEVWIEAQGPSPAPPVRPLFTPIPIPAPAST